ncbi:MAG: virulence RhuM family protein [Rikenellaceae bacterium]|nr:virulence RhuM family protein [Rikenellaceae bacterium]
MKTTKITISESGQVMIPQTVSMRSFEVAELFGVYEQKINANVKAIIKSGAISPDISGTVMVSGGVILPLDLGLDMITAVAFRHNSYRAEQYRKWVLQKISATTNKQPARVYIRLPIEASPS